VSLYCYAFDYSNCVGTYILRGHLQITRINTAPIFIEPNKTTQKTGAPQEEGSASKDKE
jgi:hypothetical protein